LLTENDVVGLTSDELERRGWTVESRLSTTERGVDIRAVKGEIRIFVEAKGEGSSKSTTARFGQSFNLGQVRTHVAVAILTALKVVAEGHALAAIAVPDNAHHRQVLGQVVEPLRGLGVVIFWVSRAAVEVEGPLP
jgi:fructose-specific component phosphotransferase system IIB-like protein